MDHLLQKNGLCNKSKSISQTPVDACETWRERGGGGGGGGGERERGETNRTKSLLEKKSERS